MTWWDRINKAKQLGNFSSFDAELAGNFGTCAIAEKLGKFDPALHDFIRSNLTVRAYDLGVSFFDAVLYNEIERAEVIYERIQRLEEVTKTI